MAKNIFRRGKLDEVMQNGPSIWVKLESDEPQLLVPLVNVEDMLTVDLHSWWDVNPAPHLVCLQDDCPSCALGNEPRLRTYIPVVTAEKEVRVLATGISTVRQLEELDDAVGGMRGKVVRFKKTGTGFNTKYSAVGTGKTVSVDSFELPDIEGLLGPIDRDEQIAKLSEAGVDVSSLRPAKPAKPAKPAGKHAGKPASKPDAKPVKGGEIVGDSGGESDDEWGEFES